MKVEVKVKVGAESYFPIEISDDVCSSFETLHNTNFLWILDRAVLGLSMVKIASSKGSDFIVISQGRTLIFQNEIVIHFRCFFISATVSYKTLQISSTIQSLGWCDHDKLTGWMNIVKTVFMGHTTIGRRYENFQIIKWREH